MTACTERHTAERAYGLVGEGQKGMPSRLSMTACTERHTAAGAHGLAGEGQKGMPKEGTVVGLLDELLAGMTADDFLVALPALRQAFEYFPPRERETIAGQVLARRGLGGSGRALLRGRADPAVVAAGMLLDDRADAVLRREGLIGSVDGGGRD